MELNYLKLKSKIDEAVSKSPYDYIVFRDLFDLCKRYESVDLIVAHEWNHEMRPKLVYAFRYYISKHDFKVAKLFDDLLYKSLVFGATRFFDDYLQAIEYGKPLDKRFYQPRRHYLKRYVDAYQEILDGKLDFLSISMPKRCGKAVTLDTLIPTPFGFKKMRDIKAGDLVMAIDGYDTRVTDVFPQGVVPVYEVKFSDGATVKTCGEHLWKVKCHNVNSRKEAYCEKVISTSDMMKHGLKSSGKNSHHVFSVELSQPAEFIYKEVKFDPYVLGVLLGDGSFMDSTVSFTSFEPELIEYVQNHLPQGDIMYCQDKRKGRYIIKSAERKTDKNGYLLKSRTAEILAELGLMKKHSYEKHVPDKYLFTTSVMRFELLAGLLDTDGYAKKSGIEYSTTSPRLKDAVLFLVRSLGGKASFSERMGRYTKNGEIKETRTNYRIHIEFPAGVNPFHVKRKADKYQPKRKKLYRYVDSIVPCGVEEAQCICVDNPEHLFLVTDYFVPTHNSQMGINFACMISGMYPDRATLMEGTGDDLVKSFYKGCLEYIIQPSDYHYADIFPNAPLVETNAELKTLNLLHKSRFPTIMCRSIDSRQVGLSEATNLLYLDDCVEGREEAKNRARLDEKWEIISGDIIGRAIEGTPIVICGTRYSLYDPIGRLQEEMEKQNKRCKIIEIPALDPDTDGSNFEYERDGKKVFTTQYFRDQREMLTAEQFESEFQQQPFEAKGLLFPEKELNRFFELPVDRDPDSIIAVCDTADSGEDFCSMPIAAVYGDEVYIIAVVFDDSPPTVTKPECANALIKNKVTACTFESNNAGSYFARDIQDILKNQNYICNIRSKRTISNKQTRIEFASDNILKHFYFLDSSLYARNSQYAQFIKQVITYTRSGKVPHDDAPDSLSLLEAELRMLIKIPVEMFKRPF